MFMQKSINIFHSVQEIKPFSLFQNLALGKASTDDKCHFAIVSLFSESEPQQKLNQSQMSFDNLMGYILSISICMQNFITIFHSVQEIVPLSLFQNLELGKASTKASTDDKCHFAIVSLFSESEPQQKLNQSQMSFDNLMGYILSISICMQNFITIFHSVQEIVPLSLFQNLELGKASTNEICHFAISWARSCQYQCLSNSLSKYSERFKS